MCFNNLNHNRLLYVESIINGYPIKRMFTDNGSYVCLQSYKDNYPALSKAAHHNKWLCRVFHQDNVICQDRIKVRLIHSYVTFHVIHAFVSSHLLLGRTWFHKHNMIPSTLPHCMKGYYNGNDISIYITKNLFSHNELYFAEVTFFDVHANERESPMVKSPRALLPMHEETKAQDSKKREKRGCHRGAKKHKRAYGIVKM